MKQQGTAEVREAVLTAFFVAVVTAAVEWGAEHLKERVAERKKAQKRKKGGK